MAERADKKEQEGKELEVEDEIVDDFGDAFDEAPEGDGGEEDEPTVTEEPEEGAEEPTADEVEEEDEVVADEDETETEGEEELEAGGDDTTESLEKVTHKYDTVSGMYNSEVKKNQKLAEELKILREGAQPSPAKDEPAKKDEPEADSSNLTEALNGSESFKEIVEEFGDTLPKALTEMANMIVQSVSKSVDSRFAAFSDTIEPLTSAHKQTAEDTHWNTLDAAHSDHEKHIDSGELAEWIEEQNGLTKKMYQEVFKDGDTQDVIDLFTTFKTAKGYNEAPAEKKEKKEKPKVDTDKLDDMEAVDSKNSPVSGTKSGAAKDDFDSAWDEA